MGADNWAVCPRCKGIAEDKRTKVIEKVKKKYGVLDADEYVRQMNAAEAPIDIGTTFSQSTEAGVDEHGTFSIKFYGYCRICRFEYSVEEHVDVDSNKCIGIVTKPAEE